MFMLTRWQRLEPQDVVVSCAKMCLDVIEGVCEELRCPLISSVVPRPPKCQELSGRRDVQGVWLLAVVMISCYMIDLSGQHYASGQLLTTQGLMITFQNFFCFVLVAPYTLLWNKIRHVINSDQHGGCWAQLWSRSPVWGLPRTVTRCR